MSTAAVPAPALEMKASRRRRTSSLPPPLLLLFSINVTSWMMASAPAAASDAPDNPSSQFLKDVVRAVAGREKWDPEAIRVSQLDGSRLKVGRSQRYEFHIRAAEMVWAFRLSDEVRSWKELKGWEGPFGPEIFSTNTGVRRRRVLKEIEMEGPLELHVAGDDELTLLLPMNTTYAGLKQVIVSEGIKLKIRGAQEVSLVVPSDLGLLNRSSATSGEYKSRLWPQELPLCRPLLSVNIQGPASVVAYRARNSKAFIETASHSPDMVELLPEKCFDRGYFKPHPSFAILSLRSRLNLLERILKTLFSDRISNNEVPQIVKAKISSALLVRFRIELEKDIHEDDLVWEKVPKWRTRPSTERARFEIVARVEGGRRLKPVLIEKLKKPFVAVETIAWSNLTSNISFTQLPPIVASPEPLTLDVKW